MAVLCSFDTCRFFGSGKCGHPRKKENGGRFNLPTYRPGKPCIWGEAKIDAADFIRAQLTNAEAKR